MKLKPILFAAFVLIFGFVFSSCHGYPVEEEAVTNELINGQVWKDSSGEFIQAHDSIIKADGMYYWYGLDYSHNLKSGDKVRFQAVKCYESKDLVHWTFKNNVLTSRASSSDLLNTADINTPCVVYNKQTKKYVMWMGYGTNKTENQTLVATCDTPYGNFNVYKSYFDLGLFVSSLFKDDDDTCYVIGYSGQSTTNIYRLKDNYLEIDDSEGSAISFINKNQFGRSAVIKDELNHYYLVVANYGINDGDVNGVDDAPNTYYSFWTSGSAGYTGASYAYCDSMLGSWSAFEMLTDKNGNIFKDYEFSNVIRIEGNGQSSYLLAFNKWNSSDLSQSAYYWHPFSIDYLKHTVTLNPCSKLYITAVTGQVTGE